MLKGQKIEYAGDALEDFQPMRFLDRFVYKNPKKSDRPSAFPADEEVVKKKVKNKNNNKNNKNKSLTGPPPSNLHLVLCTPTWCPREHS